MKRSMPKKSELKKEGLSFIRAGNDAYFTVLGDRAAVLCDTLEQARFRRDVTLPEQNARADAWMSEQLAAGRI